MIQRKPSLLCAWSPVLYLVAGVLVFTLSIWTIPLWPWLAGVLKGTALILWFKSFGRIRRR